MPNYEVGLIISDIENSAISISSKTWGQILNARTIYALEYSTLSKLLIDILNSKCEWVFFSWRGALSEVLNDRYLTKKLNLIGRNKTIYFSVPDHIDLERNLCSNIPPIYNFCDGFTVVSNRLAKGYQNINTLDKIPVILPDFPDVALLEDVASLRLKKETNSVMWIGNSKWGRSIGAIDHKGFKFLFSKIMKLSIEKQINLKYRIVDRGKKLVPHRELMKELATSSFLLQTSKSEGTGLPVIEACALGVFPITTDVGIVREIFGKNWVNHFAKSPGEFIGLIQKNIGSFDENMLRQYYAIYINEISKVANQLQFPTKKQVGNLDVQRTNYAENLQIDVFGRIRWRLRFFHIKLKSTLC